MAIKKKITIANQNQMEREQSFGDDGNAAPDHVQPFMLDVSQLRGRIVRLPGVIDAIISAHQYPRPIARLLSEALCLTTLLAGMLKFDGIFTLQIKGEGILGTLVCDITTAGILRGYASYDAEKLAANPEPDFRALMGDGYLSFTVDQANSADRYQGITALSGETLTESMQHYFLQSEQINTGFVTQIEQDNEGRWVGAAIMLQQVARHGGTVAHSDMAQPDEDEDSWHRSMILLNTLQDREMLRMETPLNTILYQLFHEEGVRVFEPVNIEKGCRCSMEKIRGVLDSLSNDDKFEYAENGVISVTCEFCNTTYEFPVENLT